MRPADVVSVVILAASHLDERAGRIEKEEVNVASPSFRASVERREEAAALRVAAKVLRDDLVLIVREQLERVKGGGSG